ncbi:ATP-dependent zinc protease [Candidatus Saccharibacteria bacterium]|nr:ATP-dependent zinc protease [Candidatus Saccharibacteria bacterium]
MITDSEKSIIGSNEYVEIAGIQKIPAKIDTGADTSSIWASNIDMKEDGTLVFSLFGPQSTLYSGKILTTREYFIKVVRSSHGDEQIRYRIKLPIVLGGMTFETTFTLSNRERNIFPVLIGRHTLEGRFLVDVSKTSVPRQTNHKTPVLNQELQIDPFKFHQKYIAGKE